MARLERAEGLARRGDDEPRPRVGRVPLLDEVADRRVGNRVVAVAAPADVRDVVGVAAPLQAVQELVDEPRRHRAVAVRHGVAPERDPDEDLGLAVRADPVERLVLPLAQNRADAVEVVGRDREVADARVRHGRDGSPRVAGHVADHGRVDRDAAPPPERTGEAEEAQQLLGPAQARELVEVHAVERDLPLGRGVEERRAVLFGEAAEVEVRRPQHFHVPDESRPLGVRGGRARVPDALAQVVDLPLLDRGLDRRVADVGVRVGENVHGEPGHGLLDERARRDLLSGDGDDDGARRLLVGGRDEHLDRIRPAREVRRLLGGALDAHGGLRRLAEVAQDDAHGLHGRAAGLLERAHGRDLVDEGARRHGRGLGAGGRLQAEPVVEEPASAQGRQADLVVAGAKQARGKRNVERVLPALGGIAEDARIAAAARQALLERRAVDLDAKGRRVGRVRVDERDPKRAVARRRDAREAEEDDERVPPRSGPVVVRAGVDVRPVAPRVRLAGDEESVGGIGGVAARCERELGVVAVGRADLPEEIGRTGGETKRAGGAQDARDT